MSGFLRSSGNCPGSGAKIVRTYLHGVPPLGGQLRKSEPRRLKLKSELRILKSIAKLRPSFEAKQFIESFSATGV